MIRLLLYMLIIYVSIKIIVTLINLLIAQFSSKGKAINVIKKKNKKDYKNIEDADFEDISDKK
ncbi:MAG: hypothetical protein O3A55_02270 [Bacteroidetes bacterium]|nr:hypothetical protein [Bacteroidota bacterium]